jgi:predicted amidohydrolase YtcJ
MSPKRWFPSSVTAVAFALAVLTVLPGPTVSAQQSSPPAAVTHYPDFIFHGGKVVTVDDRTSGTELGTIGQAVAVRDGKILAVGTSQAILAMKGPQTQVFDLRGRTVLPGIIDTHSHLNDYAINHFGKAELAKLQRRVDAQPTDKWDVISKKVLEVVREEAGKRPAGIWISVALPRQAIGPNGQVEDTITAAGRGIITLKDLDAAAPNHPVHIAAGVSAITNTKAQEVVLHDWYGPVEPELVREDGFSSNTVNRNVVAEYLVGDTEALARMFKAENFEWATFGITTWSTSIRSMRSVGAYMLLDHRGEMGIRLAYAPSMGTPPQVVPQNVAPGYGSEYLWYTGISMNGWDNAYPAIYTTIEAPEVRKEIKDREVPYGWSRVEKYSKLVEDLVASGQRFTSTHTSGDKALDLAIDAIEKGAARGGFTPDQIKAKRYAIDHCELNPRPDQIPKLQKLGIIMSCGPGFIEDSPTILRDYGEAYLNWITPVKSLLDGGVTPVLELDTHEVSQYGTVFHYLDLLVNRNVDGKTWGGRQMLDRNRALKMSTIWAAEYLLRENMIGSLEVGKLADLIVIDKDYLTIPAEQIGSIKALMTMVGGRIVHQRPELAAEPTASH